MITAKVAFLLGFHQNCIVSNFVLLPIRNFAIRHLLLLREIITIRLFVAARKRLTVIREVVFLVTLLYSRKDPMNLVHDHKAFFYNYCIKYGTPMLTFFSL